MIFSMLLMDRADTAKLRAEHREAHVAFLGKLSNRVLFGGPLKSDDGSVTLGSLLIADFPDRDAANAWIKEDPYVKHGVYKKPVIHAFVNMWQKK